MPREFIRSLCRQMDARRYVLSILQFMVDEMEESPGRKKNVAAEGLIADAREHLQEIAP